MNAFDWLAVASFAVAGGCAVALVATLVRLSLEMQKRRDFVARVERMRRAIDSMRTAAIDRRRMASGTETRSWLDFHAIALDGILSDWPREHDADRGTPNVKSRARP